MSTLKAGSYLKLLRDPEMDLMDVVDEEVPVIRTRTSSESNDVKFVLCRSWYPNDPEPDVQEFEHIMPTWWYKNTITDEKTRGLRFGNCFHEHRQLVVGPYAHPRPNVDVMTHRGSIEPEDDARHWFGYSERPRSNGLGVERSASDLGYGLVHWDEGVQNELYPGYPGEPEHLPLDEEDDLDIDEELVRAYDTIRPAITSDMSLLVTLAEIKDVWSLLAEPKALADQILHLIGRKRAGQLSLLDLVRDTDFLAWLAKKLPEGYLFDKFGYEQTKRDLCTLGSFFITLDSAVNEILSQTGTNTRHYSCPLFKGHGSDTSVFFQNEDWIMQRQWYTTLTRKFVVTIKYTSELVDAFGKPIDVNDRGLVTLELAKEKLGLNANPAVVWDLIPFSFVVDYFVRIGDWLDRFKLSNIKLTYGVQDACYSVRREITTQGLTRRWTAIGDGYYTHPDDPYSARDKYIGGITFNYRSVDYTRTRFLPTFRMLSGYRDPEISTSLSSGQLKILASLLTANIPSAKPRSLRGGKQATNYRKLERKR